MEIHASIQRIILEFEAKELHAARSGREVMEALAEVIADSQAEKSKDLALDLDPNIAALLNAMPTYAPPLNVVHTVYSLYEQALEMGDSVPKIKKAIAAQAKKLREWTVHARARIADLGAGLILSGNCIYTFTYSETVFQTFKKAWENGTRFRVLVTESRPNNDGRLTARSLAEEGIDVIIGIDGNMSELIPQADLALVGAEAILSDGSAICKVGTYPSALIAKANKVPLYVLVDSLKLHTMSLFGNQVELGLIEVDDTFHDGIDPDVDVCGSLFDRTPPEMISGLVTEKGLIHPMQVSQWMQDMPISKTISDRFCLEHLF